MHHRPLRHHLRPVYVRAVGLARGTWPYPLLQARRIAQGLRGKTFLDKLAWKMARDRRPLLQTFADKIAVRDYVRARIGEAYLAQCHQVLERGIDFRREGLPEQFVVKAAHTSGGVLVLSKKCDPKQRLPSDAATHWGRHALHPESVSDAEIRELVDSWTSRRFGWGYGSAYEWAYRDIPKRVLVEEYLASDTGAFPEDYKLYVFNGRCRLIHVVTDRDSDLQYSFYTPEWKALAIRRQRQTRSTEIAPPDTLSLMVELAETLGAETDFVRVDLYSLGSRVVFGELTSYPSGGSVGFQPAEWDRRIGSWWTAPTSYDALPQRFEG